MEKDWIKHPILHLDLNIEKYDTLESLDKKLNDNHESVNNPGIFFAGELVDIDGKCGGYNLQWAWSSGVVAAKSVFDYCNRQE